MKTRMHRFWISVSLAAGSLALPFSNALRAHDLPTRWTSGANSTPSWNYLLDDCLDMPVLPGSQSLMDVEPTVRRGTEDWASSCPAEWAADKYPAGRPIDMDYEGLLRNPISRFSKEMTCWVNEWQMIQASAMKATPSKLVWAKMPDAGNPPAPDYSIDYFAAYQPVPLADTCAFDAEYQARQTAAELLAREIARANEIAKYEATMSQSLVDADRVQATIDLDAIPAAALEAQSEVAEHGKLVSTLCGGETSEILSAQCFPNRFAPGIVDEYIAYDLDARDQHWLGGLGKSWRLRSALGSLPIPTELVAAEVGNEADVNSIADSADEFNDIVADEFTDELADEVDAWAVPVASSDSAPESFVAPEYAESDDSAFDGSSGSSLANDSASNAAELNAYLDGAYFDGLVQRAQQSALNLIHSANVATAAVLPQTDVPTELLPDLGQSLAAASDWIDQQQCVFASELCGFDSAYQVGSWLGDQSLAATGFIADNTIAMGHYLDVPASQPGLEVYVIYVDSEGNSLAVPASLARAWNRPESEFAPAAEEIAEQTFASAAEEMVEASTSDANDWAVLDQVGAQVVSVIAKQLDSLGLRLMQASDMLSSWADTQIASREESSVR